MVFRRLDIKETNPLGIKKLLFPPKMPIFTRITVFTGNPDSRA